MPMNDFVYQQLLLNNYNKFLQVIQMIPQHKYANQYMVPFNWYKDKDVPLEQLFLKAFLYCTQHLTLSKDLFTGEHELFRQYKSAINLSGGFEYHNPTYCLSLSLLHNFTQQQLEQYVILYHGVRNNQNFKEIFKTRLRPGPGQAYQGSKARNSKLTVPNGVYGSQFLNVTMGYVDQHYPIVIQFATKPNSLQNPQSCVMTNTKNIFVVQEAIPIKLLFPFTGVNRCDGFL